MREPHPERTPDGCAARRRRTHGTARGRATGPSRTAHTAWDGAAPVPPPVLWFFVDRAVSPDKKVDVPGRGSGSTKVTSPIHEKTEIEVDFLMHDPLYRRSCIKKPT